VNTTNTNSAFKTILWTGFVAGLMDIIAAVIKYTIEQNREPTKLFQFIASGVFGKEAFTGGMGMAALGLLFHFLLAYIFAIIFFLIYPRIHFLSRNKVLTGLVYGVLVWIVMNLVVLPLSNAPRLPFKPEQALIGMIILMVCVGLPIALIVHKHYFGRRTRLTNLS
jgi:uncharacterized membrane protein YagU involved in acid resistance